MPIGAFIFVLQFSQLLNVQAKRKTTSINQWPLREE